MIVRTPTPLALDRLWRETFHPADRGLRLATDLTGATAQIRLRETYRRESPNDWWYGDPGTILGTDTGEIINDNTKLSVTARIKPGLYNLTGEYTKDGTTVPFAKGRLRVADYMSQLSLDPLGEV